MATDRETEENPSFASQRVQNSSTLPLISTNSDEEYTVDEALTVFGDGWAQKVLLALLGWTYSAGSAAAALMLFLEPNVKCEWGLTRSQETLLSVVMFLGFLLGAYLWGALADQYGRKWSVIGPVVLQGVAGICSSLAPNYWMLVVCRGVTGLGAGSVTAYSMYCEFLPPVSRGLNLSWYEMFFTVGVVLETALAWWIVPRHGWRTLALVTALLAIVLIPPLLLVPESPRYLLVSGIPERATAVLNRIGRFNGAPRLTGRLKPCAAEDVIQRNGWVGFSRQLANLFRPPLHKVTAILWLTLFIHGLGYYGAMILTASVRSEDDQAACIGDEADVDRDDYVSIFLGALSEVPAIFLALLTIERLGRIKSTVLSLSGCCIGLLGLLCLPSAKTVFLCVVRLFVAYANILVYLLPSELYPSPCRSFAVGMIGCIYRLGGAISPIISRALYHEYGLALVSGLYASMYLVASIAAMFLLPYETAGKSLADDMTQLLAESTANT